MRKHVNNEWRYDMDRTDRSRSARSRIASALVAAAVSASAFAGLGPAAMPVSVAMAEEVAPQVADAQLAADLAFMREEEKLAGDVYAALAAKWGAKTFSNIAKSEQRHSAAVLVLLNAYGVDDPAAGKGPGEFTNPDLQALYTQLVERGSASLSEAYQVGKTIEELDIADLDQRIARTTQADVLLVYKNLRAASVKHLAAFDKKIAGETGSANGKGKGKTAKGKGKGKGGRGRK